MPNYSLVADASYSPFTYDELVAPVAAMSEAHDKMNAYLDTLSDQVDILEAMGELDKNSQAYRNYKRYQDNISATADLLNKYGMVAPAARTSAFALRRQYNQEIVPIRNAWTKREQEAKEQMDAYRNNPHLMFTRDAATTTLDEYIANPMGGYGIVDGDNITKQVEDAVKNLKEKVDIGDISMSNIDPYTQIILRKGGMDENEINQWL